SFICLTNDGQKTLASLQKTVEESLEAGLDFLI
ncbi:MarR family transcriptional regulator, partial [Streptococcus pneumoniae]|nr:MarR family transcriptional regulator [Streptococcus pneumoniae]